jgi:outer membrane protein OmpA-like peptidoglycan-associated protein
MKARLLGAVMGVVITASLTLSHVVYSQSQNYYIVIGTFSSKDDATEFTDLARTKYLDSSFVSNADNLFQLYVLKTSSKEAAISKTAQLQQELNTPINEPLRGTLGNAEFRSSNAANDEQRALSTFADASDHTSSSASSANAVVSSGAPLRPRGKFFKFTISTSDGNILPAQIHHVDLERAVDLATYNSNDYIDILKQGKDASSMTMVCGVFGYKEVEKFIDYTDPASTSGIYQDENGAWVIPYTLERLEKGDVSIMYNVSFYKDAVVMLSNSKKEMDDLVTMMEANPNYSIKVHGHCNGKKNRRIIALGESKNYFDINGSNEINGSAKELSSLRADAVRSYLLDHGIAENRIKTFAWGGSYMLVDAESTYSKLNDRIEIEILKD